MTMLYAQRRMCLVALSVMVLLGGLEYVSGFAPTLVSSRLVGKRSSPLATTDSIRAPRLTVTGALPSPTAAGASSTRLFRRRADDYYDDDGYYYGDDEDDYDEDDIFDDGGQQRKRRRRRRIIRDDLGQAEDGRQDGGFGLPSPFGRRGGWRLPESASKALLAGTLILGVGLGVTIDSAINTNPKDLASRDAVDQAAPNSSLCAKYGASAMAFDQRVFVSFNPFNVYVAQADVKPACVLRPSNAVPVLMDRKLINDQEVRSCKNNMNTWAFVGDLESLPQLSCVYKSEDAQNEFLSNPKLGIGEDVYDDDRANALHDGKNNKSIKTALTEQQKAALRRQANGLPGFD